jgi:glycosyltransferase involved in cell wall biosynthesis
MKRLRIGIFTYDFFPIIGGQGRHVYELYKQNEKNKKVDLFIFSPSVNTLRNNITIFPESINSKLKHIEFSYKLTNKVNDLVEQFDLDIVHFHGGPGGIILFKKTSVPCIFTAHHTYWQQSSYMRQQTWKKIFVPFEKKSYYLANKIICVSEDTRSILVKKYGVLPNKTTYIPNGISKPQKIRDTNRNNKEIIYIGRIDKRKGLDFLLEAMDIVNQKDDSIKLHIVGDGVDKKRLETFAAERSLNANFYGYLSDEKIQKLFDLSSLQVVPSLFEGFGISVLEGMSHRVPVIATNVDGIRNVVKHNYNGLLVEYGDISRLSEEILRLTNDKQLQDLLISNAYKELYKYSWENIYTSTISEYESII